MHFKALKIKKWIQKDFSGGKTEKFSAKQPLLKNSVLPETQKGHLFVIC